MAKNKMICANSECSHKGKNQGLFNFYTYKKDGQTLKYPICKDCLKASVNLNDMNTIYNILRDMNVAFVPDVWKNMVVKNPENPLGNYLRVISNLAMYKGMQFSESQTLNVAIDNSVLLERARVIKEEPQIVGSNTLIIPEDKLQEYRKFWGEGFSAEEYISMQNKYEVLKESYPGNTAFHVEGLRNYIIPRVKADISIAQGKDNQAKTWLDLADKAAKAAKINVAQLSKNELGAGENSFAMWSKAVEEATDIGGLIDILKTLQYQPIDSVDFEIWCIANFYRDLNGKPPVSYPEVYQFYDKMKEDYINDTGDPYGIFDGDTTNKMREKIKVFIEPLKEEDDDGKEN